MGGPILCECGNTTVKCQHGGERVRLAPEDAPAWLAARRASLLVLLPTAARTSRVVRAAWPGRCVVAGSPELPLPDLGQYPGMGLDRIVAGLAAGPDAIVVDAGTAITLTAWGADGRCLGGLILPGARALAAGLAACAPALPEVRPTPGLSACQRDPAGAIAAALGIALPAMAAACLTRLRADSGCRRTLVTGGDAALLGIDGEARPWLVLDGLQALAERAGLSERRG